MEVSFDCYDFFLTLSIWTSGWGFVCMLYLLDCSVIDKAKTRRFILNQLWQWPYTFCKYFNSEKIT